MRPRFLVVEGHDHCIAAALSYFGALGKEAVIVGDYESAVRELSTGDYYAAFIAKYLPSRPGGPVGAYGFRLSSFAAEHAIPSVVCEEDQTSPEGSTLYYVRGGHVGSGPIKRSAAGWERAHQTLDEWYSPDLIAVSKARQKTF